MCKVGWWEDGGKRADGHNQEKVLCQIACVGGTQEALRSETCASRVRNRPRGSTEGCLWEMGLREHAKNVHYGSYGSMVGFCCVVELTEGFAYNCVRYERLDRLDRELIN